MNYKTIKRPEKRVRQQYSASWDIQLYGDDNLYPERMSDLIGNSPTGGTCLERYISFLEGNGLNSDTLSALVCNRRGDTADDVLHLVARDVAMHNGFALHVNYNLAAEITEVQHVPFRSCRIGEEDDAGYIPFVYLHPDWEGNKTRRGKTVTVNQKNIRPVYLFNPRREVVTAQIEADGGIEQYRGQVLWVSLAGRYVYPTAIYDKIATELSVDEGLSNVKYRNVRNNFLLSGMLIRRKGTSVTLDEDGTETVSDDDDEAFQTELEAFQGDTNACSLMDVTYQQEEDIPKFVSVEGVNFDRKFAATESSTTERIYAAFGQEPWYCVRVGKVGFSGDVLREAYEYYNSYVANTRRIISRELQRVFRCWHEPGICPDGDYSIQPLVYQYNYSNGNLDEQQKQNGYEGTTHGT